MTTSYHPGILISQPISKNRIKEKQVARTEWSRTDTLVTDGELNFSWVQPRLSFVRDMAY